jgi:hypothetical protein
MIAIPRSVRQQMRGPSAHPDASGAAPQHSALIRLLPIVVVLSYLTFTVVLFILGPWQFPVDNPFPLYLFLTLAHAALLLGYLTGIRRRPQGYSGKWRVSKLVFWSSMVNLVLLFPTSLHRTGSVIPNVVFGLTNPGEAYDLAYDLGETGDPAVEYIRILIGPWLGLMFPLAVFYWPRLTRMNRYLSLAGILTTIFLFVAMGKNKGIADTVLLVPILVIASSLAGIIELGPRKLLALAVTAVGALVLFVSFFGTVVSSRQGSTVGYAYFAATRTGADYNNFLVRNLSDRSATAIQGLDLYLTQGYYALSLALQEPFVPTWGVGNSIFLSRQAARLTGNEQILDANYPARIERYGWDAFGLWSSIYPWIASDVSFPGTIVVVFLIGRLFVLLWLDTLQGANPFAVALFSQVVIMLFYFPANNQLLQSGEGFTAFWVTLLLWWRTRRENANRARRIVARPAHSYQ